MEVKKPSIYIASGIDNKNIKQIYYGIEEEEIPFTFVDDEKIENLSSMETIKKAYQASLSSQLGVGIAFDDSFAYLHQKSLPENEPLFRVRTTDLENLNQLGTNAARLVKGIPFKEIKEGD
ncbi:glycerol dehydratase reactivase beta/small subunit family protein [Lactobacillus terrae]|uniref:glycerol dehydratase reactivase beta/small subunit family protein n=1 Tax=Lactobacillus terrae TaxID=2269374 RepID=UPI000C1B6D15|nr:glycerol dehydratase reactivase beta/small subunit family protein [Lactobacillus terrae]